jgi:hypothetical protein
MQKNVQSNTARVVESFLHGLCDLFANASEESMVPILLQERFSLAMQENGRAKVTTGSELPHL